MTVSTVCSVPSPSAVTKSDLTMCAHRPSLEEMEILFSSRTSMVEFGRKPGGVGSLITYMVSG